MNAVPEIRPVESRSHGEARSHDVHASAPWVRQGFDGSLTGIVAEIPPGGPMEVPSHPLPGEVPPEPQPPVKEPPIPPEMPAPPRAINVTARTTRRTIWIAK